jgi:hypothetical protein
LYYYFGTPDFDSADDSYDPTRECFHIDGAIASDSEAEAAARGGNPTPSHTALHGTRDEAQLLKADQGAQLVHERIKMPKRGGELGFSKN